MSLGQLGPQYMATRDEVEAHFGYPTRRALELFAVNGGGPKVTRIGRRCLYRVGDVEAWLRSFADRDENPEASGGAENAKAR